jgi:chloramphenicol O-acetyltransferase type B
MRESRSRLQKIWDKLRGKHHLDKAERTRIKFEQRYPRFELGKHSYGLPIVHDWQDGTTLKIGAYCSIARNVQIFLGGNHRTDWVTTYPFPAFFKEARHISDYARSRGDVVIGNDVWLCTDCTILSGVTIGHGAVIGSGAVVRRDVEPYAIMIGNPAQVAGWRFNEAQRQALLEAAWWDWPEEEIRSVVDRLCSSDIEAFLAYARQRHQA